MRLQQTKQHLTRLLIVSFSAGSLALTGCVQQRDSAQDNAQAQTPTPTASVTPSSNPTETAQPETAQRQPDVVYVPTPTEVVDRMLALAKVKNNDVIYDLGSGDGRIVITAAQKLGATGVGVDIDPERIREANENAQKAKVTDRVQFRQQDLFQTDLRQASVVTLYLLPDLNLKLRPKLFQELKPGTRVVSHDFDMGDWKPERTERINVGGRQHTVYYWVIPSKVPANFRP
ncbi:MAG: class I SAM-dependent methyltransferase [Tildeniella nuda ZEHNDER 1965/U140]|jgi:predicted O-methyltransferase YrrM|nr:class I SAM-dependent methyltransferase [Tildeniella nuda ZEHNDER 1965/U140]